MFLTLQNLESPSAKDICAKIGRLWSDGFGEEDF